MWDNETLPMYDGSFTSIIILISLYLRLIVYWLGIFAGVIFVFILLLSPFFVGYFGIKSLQVKIKHTKKWKKKHKQSKEHEKGSQDSYLYRLENSLKKNERKHGKLR